MSTLTIETQNANERFSVASGVSFLVNSVKSVRRSNDNRNKASKNANMATSFSSKFELFLMDELPMHLADGDFQKKKARKAMRSSIIPIGIIISINTE